MGLCPTFEHAAIMKLLLFGYDASGNRHDGTWVTAPVKRGGSEMDWPKNEFCGMIPNSCLRVLRKQAGGNRTWEALLEAEYHFTIHHFTVSPLLCPWLVKCLVRAFSVASHLLLLFIHSPLLAVDDKSHTRLSSRLPRCCLCLIFDALSITWPYTYCSSEAVCVSSELLMDGLLLHLSLMHTSKFFRYLCRAPQVPSVNLPLNPRSFSRPSYSV